MSNISDDKTSKNNIFNQGESEGKLAVLRSAVAKEVREDCLDEIVYYTDDEKAVLCDKDYIDHAKKLYRIIAEELKIPAEKEAYRHHFERHKSHLTQYLMNEGYSKEVLDECLDYNSAKFLAADKAVRHVMLYINSSKFKNKISNTNSAVNCVTDSKEMTKAEQSVDLSKNTDKVEQHNTSEVKNDYFSVTPVDFDENKDVKHVVKEVTVNIEELRKRALDDGYGPTAVEGAIALVDENTKSYKDFEALIEKALSNVKEEELEKELKNKRLRESIQLELGRLRKINDIATYADSLIYNVYNTTAVVALDIVKRASDEQLNLEIYEYPIYSVILQINKDWVANTVTSILADWETKDYPKQFVDAYLRSIGVPEDKFEINKQDLLKVLPDSIRNEKSPDIYKQFKAVNIITQSKDPNEDKDLEEKIFSQAIKSIEYSANFEKALDDDMPALAASAAATEAVIESMPEEDKKRFSIESVAGVAGAFCGKVIGFKYKTAKTFDDMLRENAGEYGEIWAANREAVRQRKEELKQRKAEIKHEEKIAKMQAEHEIKLAEASRPAQNNHYATEPNYTNRRRNNNYNNYNNYGNQRVNRDFGSQMSGKVKMVLIHIVITLILLLLMSKDLYRLMLLGGVILAVTGVYRLMNRTKEGLPNVIAGYSLVILAVYLNFM